MKYSNAGPVEPSEAEINLVFATSLNKAIINEAGKANTVRTMRITSVFNISCFILEKSSN